MFKINKISFLSLLIYLIPISFLFGIFITEIIVFCISILFLYICFVNKISIYFKSYFFKILLIIYFFLNINSFFSENMLVSFKVSVPYIRHILLSLAIWFALENNKNFIKEFSYFFCFTIALLVIDGFIQYIFGSNLIGYSTKTARLSSFFFDEWILGSFIQKFYPLLILVLFYNLKIDKYFYFKILFLILSYLIVFFSGERAAFFLLTLYNILILIPLFLIRKKINKIFYFFLPLIIIVFYFTPIGERVFLLESNSYDTYTTSFLEFYNIVYSEFHKTSINIFQDNKVIGSGIKTFRYVCKEYYETDAVLACSTHPHNYYMQVLAECGLIGFTIILLVLLFLIINYFRIFTLSKSHIKKNFNIIVLLSSLLVYLWPFTTSGSLFNNFISIILFYNLGFFIKYINGNRGWNII